MGKGLITEYNYTEEPDKSYQILKEFEDGSVVVVLNGLTQTMEIKGLENAMDYVSTLNEHAVGHKYKVRGI